MVTTELNKLYSRIGKNIAFLRKKKNLSQEKLAEELNMGSGQSIISQYETGKKSLSLGKLEYICTYFSISLEELMFSNLCTAKDSNEEQTVSEDPIHKFTVSTFYCYYITEQNKNDKQFASKVTCFEVVVLRALDSHSAKVELYLEKKSNTDVGKKYDGTLYMDESYAYIESHNFKKDFFLRLTFFYHRQSTTSKYKGGLGLLQKMDCNRLPVFQFCIISPNVIAHKNHDALKELLSFNLTKEDKSLPLSDQVYSSSAILRLTQSKDQEVFTWLKNI